MRNNRKRRSGKLIAGALAISFVIEGLVAITAYATPNSFNVETTGPIKTTVNINGNYKDENPTGLKRRGGETTLKEDINKLLPYLETMLQEVYDKAEQEVKDKIKENGWDYEYTMTSFYDKGNPYTKMDYNQLIAVYTTIVEMGRNDRGLLSDVPFILLEYDEQEEDGNKYAEVGMKMLDLDGILKFYGYDADDADIKKKVRERRKKIEDALNDVDINKNMFVLTPEIVTDRIERIDNVASIDGYEIPQDLPIERKMVIATALSLIGKVPYDWGGKPSKAGIDKSWWTANNNPDRGTLKGLDCSGFVQWAFLTAGFEKETYDKLISTYAIRENLDYIEADELQPGDLGLMKNNSNGTNHVGIYLGNGLWVHCSSAAKTVTVNNYGFRYFKRFPDGKYDMDIAMQYFGDAFEGAMVRPASPRTDIAGDGIEATESEIYTLAQLIEHEVGGEPEGVDAWVAVAEVVLNRVNYKSSFENTLLGVIYEPHQFSYVEEIKDITPRPQVIDVARNVLNGTLKYFDEPRIVFFKNPMITNGIPSTEKVDWGKHPWYGNVGKTAFYLDH